MERNGNPKLQDGGGRKMIRETTCFVKRHAAQEDGIEIGDAENIKETPNNARKNRGKTKRIKEDDKKRQ